MQVGRNPLNYTIDTKNYQVNSNQVKDQVFDEKSHSSIYKNMPNNLKEAFITSLDSIDAKDRLMAVTLVFDLSALNSELSGKECKSSTMDYKYLQNRVSNILENDKTAQWVKDATQNFWDVFNENFKEKEEVASTSTRSSEVDKFLKELTDKGASTVLAIQNQEKIDEMIEEYRDKLTSKMGNSPESLVEIEKMILDKIQNSLDNFDEKEKDGMVSLEKVLRTLE